MTEPLPTTKVPFDGALKAFKAGRALEVLVQSHHEPPIYSWRELVGLPRDGGIHRIVPEGDDLTALVADVTPEEYEATRDALEADPQGPGVIRGFHIVNHVLALRRKRAGV